MSEWVVPVALFVVFVLAVVGFVVWATIDLAADERRLREHKRKLFRRGRIKKVDEWER